MPADTAKTTVSRDYATALSSNSWGSITYADSMKLADTTLINAYSDYEDEAPENIDSVCEWLVVPFSATGCPLTLKYKIDGVSFVGNSRRFRRESVRNIRLYLNSTR